MDKLKMHSKDFTDENIARIAELFPNCVTEVEAGIKEDKDGHEEKEYKKVIDFDLLKQELSDKIVDGPRERYRLDWPGKREALLAANAPIAKTLRPCREESVDFDNTENLFIEGDNLDALKLLQENYLGKVKMIYIDPPYNTGKDFIYSDNFAESGEEYLLDSGQEDEDGNRLVANSESNGRFHSDWLSMMYSRLKLARNLLRDDGVIFISIDDGELSNLRRICDEVFGEENYRNTILTRRRVKSLNSQFADNGLYSMNIGFEYVLAIGKSASFLMKALQMKKKDVPKKGRWDVFWSNADRPTMRYDILGFTPQTGQWRTSKEKADIAVANYQKYVTEFETTMSIEEYSKTSGIKKFIRRIPDGAGKNGGVQHWIAPSDSTLRTSNWTDIEVSQIGKEIDLPFDNPKSKQLCMELIKLADLNTSDIILDFFAGSATTAHAVMQLNAEDNGKRKFIMVQLPEECDERAEAFKAGYKNIAEISKERIRRAGKKIAGELAEKQDKSKDDLFDSSLPHKLDIGFRVLKVSDSNMEDIYYRPDQLEQGQLELHSDNIKFDRSDEDLLFQVLLDWGVELTLPIMKENISGREVFFVDGNALAACFVSNGKIDEDFCKELAKREPLRVVFRDSGFTDDSAKINVEQIFKLLSPHTEVKTI